MLGIFRKKEKEEPKPAEFDVSSFDNNCIECPTCGKNLKLDDFKPLTIEKCPSCESPNYIPLKIKEFWLVQPLGGGGMGSVYKAVHARNRNFVFAVKILARNSRNDQHLIQALLNEAAIAKSFGKHPHLIPVIDYGHFQDEYYSAMEFVDGKRLDQIIEEKENISQKYVLLWGLQLLSAEQRIYDSGYLFRDMKPQNIIIDNNGNVRLFGFGLCTSIENASKNNSSDTIEGSPIYMPPERIVGYPENMSSEIYSIGMVLFHVFTGKPYYSSTDAYNLAKKHVTSLRVANIASRMPKNVNPRITEIIDKMVARAPEERFQSFKELGIEINKVYQSLK